MKIYACISILTVMLFTQSVAWGETHFNFETIRMRENPDVNAKIIEVIPEGSLFGVREKSTQVSFIDKFKSNWFKIDYKGKQGWVFGGYVIEKGKRHIPEFLKRYQFIRYFKDVKSWDSNDVDGVECSFLGLSMGCRLHDECFSNSDHFEFNLPILKRSDLKKSIYDSIKTITWVIGDFKKVDKGYELYLKDDYREGGVLLAKKGAHIATVGMQGENLKIYNIMNFTYRKYGLEVNTRDLMKLTFKKIPTYKYWDWE